MSTKNLTEAAKADKLIRKELKQAFPKIKFTIRSGAHLWVSSVNVGWNNGPTLKSVETLLSKYEYGHFDDMIDSYVLSNVKDIPQVQYTSTNRKIDDELKLKALDDLKLYLDEWIGCAQHIINSTFLDYDLTDGYSWEDFKGKFKEKLLTT